VTSSPSWVTFTSPTNGSSAASIDYTLADHGGSSSRNGTIVVQGTSGNVAISVTQGGNGGYVGTLPSGGVLYPGQALYSPNGQYQLFFQHDGNLVLYGPGGFMWASNTARDPDAFRGWAGYAVMQGDGNFVAYTSWGSHIYDTGTGGLNGARLVLDDDGRVVIYDVNDEQRWWRP
jgi:hypothetical protein